jgi:prepilin-type processing-associated H-X9-DG protein
MNNLLARANQGTNLDYTPLQKIRRSAEVFLIGDAVNNDPNAAALGYVCGDMISTRANWNNIDPRHGRSPQGKTGKNGGANICFADGHVERITKWPAEGSGYYFTANVDPYTSIQWTGK